MGLEELYPGAFRILIQQGSLYFFVDDNHIIITSLIIHKDFRGQGFGLQLIEECISFAKTNQIHKLILDDMSDRFGLKNNIYVKKGFSYVSLDENLVPNGPEMELCL